jgi:hypothetical protein
MVLVPKYQPSDQTSMPDDSSNSLRKSLIEDELIGIEVGLNIATAVVIQTQDMCNLLVLV